MHEALKWETLRARWPNCRMAICSRRPIRRPTPTSNRCCARNSRPPGRCRSFISAPTNRSISAAAARRARPQVFAAHVNRVAAVVSAAGARPMIWDDAIQQRSLDPRAAPQAHRDRDVPLRRRTVIRAATSRRSTGPASISSSRRARTTGTSSTPTSTPPTPTKAQFLADAKAARSPHVLGMFETVWHDDGESLYEATWAPVAFAAARRLASRAGRSRQLASHASRSSFFGSDDPGFAADLDDLGRDARRVAHEARERPARLPLLGRSRSTRASKRACRRSTCTGCACAPSALLDHLARARPPLNAQAAR